MPIQSFRHKGLKRLFANGDARGIPSHLEDRLKDMLAAIETANSVEDIGLFPGWRLHALKGDLSGHWSLAVSGNWRIVFRFKDGDAFDVDFVDYH